MGCTNYKVLFDGIWICIHITSVIYLYNCLTIVETIAIYNIDIIINFGKKIIMLDEFFLALLKVNFYFMVKLRFLLNLFQTVKISCFYLKSWFVTSISFIDYSTCRSVVNFKYIYKGNGSFVNKELNYKFNYRNGCKLCNINHG